MTKPKMKEFAKFLAEVEAVEQRAHALGLNATAHMVNAAKNRAGWEIADKVATPAVIVNKGKA